MNHGHYPISPLLALPFPIRDQIWRFAYGNQLIHVQYSHTGVNRTSLFCKEPHLETIQEISLIAQNGLILPCLILQDDIPDVFRCRHERCQQQVDLVRRQRRDQNSSATPSSPDSNLRMLGAMLACRQFHDEIQPIVYATNMFQMESATAFLAFMETPRPPLRRRALSIRLDTTSWTQDSSRYWPIVLTPRAAGWVEQHVRRLEIVSLVRTAYYSGYILLDKQVTAFANAVEVPQFGEVARDHSLGATIHLRPPSPARVGATERVKRLLAEDAAYLLNIQAFSSPLWHLRCLVKRLRGWGEVQTREQYRQEQISYERR